MKLSERIRSGHGISGNLADAAEALERDLDAERSRCMDLAARLDRARIDLRAAKAARSATILVDAIRTRLAAAEAGMAVVHFFDLARMQRLREVVQDFANMECEADCRRNTAQKAASALHRRAQAAESRAIKAERQAEVQRRRADSEMAERRELHAALRRICSTDYDAAYDIVRDVLAALPAHARPDAAPVDTRTGEVEQAIRIGRAVMADLVDPALLGDLRRAAHYRMLLRDDPKAARERESTRTGEVTVGVDMASGPEAVFVNGVRQPDRPAPEATREWAVGDACEVIQSGDGDDAATWEPGTIVGFTDGGIVIDPIPPRKYFSWRLPEGVRRPIPPTAMEPTDGGNRQEEAPMDEADNVRELLAEGRRLREETEKRLAPMKVPVDEDCDLEDLTRRRVTERAERSPFFVTLAEMEETRGLLRTAKLAVEEATVDLRDRDTRIADLERRLREAEGQRDEALAQISDIAEQCAANGMDVAARDERIATLRKERDDAWRDVGAHAGRTASARAERDAERARAERAEERLRRVKERCARVPERWSPEHDLAVDVMAIIEEESGR